VLAQVRAALLLEPVVRADLAALQVPVALRRALAALLLALAVLPVAPAALRLQVGLRVAAAPVLVVPRAAAARPSTCPSPSRSSMT
jgi:hypothetical protein